MAERLSHIDVKGLDVWRNDIRSNHGSTSPIGEHSMSFSEISQRKLPSYFWYSLILVLIQLLVLATSHFWRGLRLVSLKDLCSRRPNSTNSLLSSTVCTTFLMSSLSHLVTVLWFSRVRQTEHRKSHIFAEGL